jgi:hypothetical protein
MALFHFTKTTKAITNIFTHGFAYVALPTKVASFVLPDIPIEGREPQQFGMICFRHEMEGERSAAHRKKYGPFGIAVDEAWAKSHGAHPVFYLDEAGSVGRALKRLLTSAVSSVRAEEIRFPDDSARRMAYHNKNMASVLGASEWAKLLDLFQYLAPLEDEWEREWRIVRGLPAYNIPQTGTEAVAKVSPPHGWTSVINVLNFPRSAVLYLVAPIGSEETLRAALPSEYQDIEIKEECACPTS